MMDFSIRAALYDPSGRPSPFWLIPRSSANLRMLVVSPGVMDANYRGNLTLPIRFLRSSAPMKPHELYTRLVQICAPDLSPISVTVVPSLRPYPSASPERSRGAQGFGSSGR
jgi:dUTPase